MARPDQITSAVARWATSHTDAAEAHPGGSYEIAVLFADRGARDRTQAAFDEHWDTDAIRPYLLGPGDRAPMGCRIRAVATVGPVVRTGDWALSLVGRCAKGAGRPEAWKDLAVPVPLERGPVPRAPAVESE